MRTCCFFLFNFLGLSLFSQTWSTLNVPYSGRYDDIFLLGDRGWACDGDGRIHHTLNGGSSWAVQANLNNYLRSIEFMDADTGFCGGLQSSGQLYRTTNGGASWQNITSSLPDLTEGICGLSCPGNGVVYGCGVWSEPAYVVKSTNGGQDWQLIDMSAYASRLVDILFITPDSGWVSGTANPSSQGGILLSTSDGGQTWHKKITTNHADDYVWKIQTPDSLHFFGSIERAELPGLKTEFLKSTDGGQTWTRKTLFAQSHRTQMIGFLDPLHGMAGDFSLFLTSDGGQTWTLSTGPGGSYNRFWRLGPSAALVTGNKLYRYTAPATSATEATPGQSAGTAEMHPMRVSPNPAAGHLRIDIELAAHTKVWLKILPIDGKGDEITLWTGEHPAGAYRFSTDLPENWSGQAALVWFKTNHGTQQRIVPLLRGR